MLTFNVSYHVLGSWWFDLIYNVISIYIWLGIMCPDLYYHYILPQMCARPFALLIFSFVSYRTVLPRQFKLLRRIYWFLHFFLWYSAVGHHGLSFKNISWRLVYQSHHFSFVVSTTSVLKYMTLLTFFCSFDFSTFL